MLMVEDYISVLYKVYDGCVEVFEGTVEKITSDIVTLQTSTAGTVALRIKDCISVYRRSWQKIDLEE